MTPELLGLKVALIIAVGGVVLFSACYTWWTRWACWRDPIGLTVQLEAWFLALAFAPLLLASFFHLDATSNAVGSWTLIAGIALAGLVLLWRTVVFGLLHYSKGRQSK